MLIYGLIREAYGQKYLFLIETLDTEKKSPNTQIEKKNTKNRSATDPNTTKQMLTQEDKIHVELIKKIITEEKTKLTSLRNKDRKKLRQ